MKNSLTLLVIFLYFCNFTIAQSIDSTYIKKVDSLLQFASNLTDDQDYEKALELNDEAKTLTLQHIGEESESYAKCYHHSGRSYQAIGKFPEAEIEYLNAKKLKEKIYGKEHLKYARTLNNLANLYRQTGEYEKSEHLFLQVKKIREKELGKEHPDYAKILNNLATLYAVIGYYELAEPIFLETKSIWSKTLGKNHPYYSVCLMNLSGIYDNMGLYEKAEPMSIEAIEILSKAQEKEFTYYLTICKNNLAALYQDMGQYEKAEKLLFESLKNAEETMGKEHADYAWSLINLATLYTEIGEYAKAEPYTLEATEIMAKTLGKEHSRYAEALATLADLYLAEGKYKETELLAKEVLTIKEKALGKEHPDYANSLDRLADAYIGTGLHEKAEPLYLQSIEIRKRILGKEHPDNINTYIQLAELYDNTNQFQKAEKLYLGLSAIYQNLFSNAIHYLSEQELSNYLKKYSKSQEQFLSFTQRSNSEKMKETCFENSLFYKGFLLNSMNQFRRIATSNPNTAEKFDRLKGYHRRLATEYALPIAQRDSAVLSELEAMSNTLEKDIIITVAETDEKLQIIKWQEVQHQLSPNEAVIEFVNYRFQEKENPELINYAALILFPDGKPPKFIPLFEESQLGDLVKNHDTDKIQQINSLYKDNLLNELIWHPLKEELTETKTIYYSPSRLLHRINLNAFLSNKKNRLNNQYKLVRLNSTRQLAFPSEIENNKNNALLFGGINYEMDTTAVFSENIDYNKTASRGSLSFIQSDSNHRGDSWDYLEWTEVEVSAIEAILNTNDFIVELNKASKASEEKFKSIPSPSPRILHIATHGFFFPDPKTKDGKRLTDHEPVFKISDHPMIRSGLIMAGGNHAWKTGKPFKPNMEDGILTAYEISQMDLSNTELVVLSACETGLGDIDGNEGVYGLQRAFKIAGAKYLIMSLWQVPDYPTQQLMTAFYNNWLSKDMEIPDAFRAAQNEMKERFDDPFMWAGFVLVE